MLIETKTDFLAITTPISSTINAFARFADETGNEIKNSQTIEDNSGNITLGNIAAGNAGNFNVTNAGVIVYRTAAQVLGDIGAAASAHLHDGDTLQLDAINSDGGAFPFTTSGAVSFSQNIIIPDAGNIGSVTTPGAVAIDASGNVTVAGTVTLMAGTSGPPLIFKEGLTATLVSGTVDFDGTDLYITLTV